MTEFITIDEVCPKGQVYPMILNFQNGYPSEDFDVDCMLLEDKETRIKTIATELNGLVYAGNEVKEEIGQTFILARNRKTGKTRLIEVGTADMKPVFDIDLETPKELDTSKLELSRKFGSKKQKQQMEHREKLKVNIQTVTKQMEKVTKNVSEDRLNLSAYNKGDSDDFYIPPIDRQASKVEDVYDLNKILTDNEYEAIYSEIESKDYMSDFDPWIKSVVTAKQNISPRLTVLAVYANALVKFSSVKATDLKKKTYRACNQSSTLNEIIINNFTTLSNGNRNRPLQYKDKSICYFIVFMLILSNYKFEMEPLCSVLNMTPATVGLKVRVAGATVSNTGDKKMVQLKFPLNTKSAFRRKSAKF